jgi:acetate kinase
MNILVVNFGSATLKYKVIGPGETCLRRGQCPIAEGMDGIEAAWQGIQIDAIGHRVVHGGSKYRESVVIDPSVLDEIQALNELAPLHNPSAHAGIQHLTRLGLPQVAVFDTAFHATLPKHAYTYALPAELAEKHGIRRFGFHGIAHQYAALRHAELAGTQARVISLHLGNGCSACAIADGKSIETSMGLTPLEGLMMGTRSGDIDPGLIPYISRRENWTLDRIEKMLTEESGLKGVSGVSQDIRHLTGESGSFAVDLFCYRVKKYVGAYASVLGGLDSILFTGGIGENSADVRSRVASGLEWLGVSLDEDRNQQGGEGAIHQGKVGIWVISGDEELMIAREVIRLLG